MPLSDYIPRPNFSRFLIWKRQTVWNMEYDVLKASSTYRTKKLQRLVGYCFDSYGLTRYIKDEDIRKDVQDKIKEKRIEFAKRHKQTPEIQSNDTTK